MAEPNANQLKEQIRAVVESITELVLTMLLGTGQQENEKISTTEDTSETVDGKE